MSRFVSTSADIIVKPPRRAEKSSISAPNKKTPPVQARLVASRRMTPMNGVREAVEAPIPDEVLAEMEEEVDGWAREWGAVLVKAARKGRPNNERRREAQHPVQATLVEAKFDPTKHPKQPAGSSKGGEFAPAGGGTQDAIDQMADKDVFSLTSRPTTALGGVQIRPRRGKYTPGLLFHAAPASRLAAIKAGGIQPQPAEKQQWVGVARRRSSEPDSVYAWTTPYLAEEHALNQQARTGEPQVIIAIKVPKDLMDWEQDTRADPSGNMARMGSVLKRGGIDASAIVRVRHVER